MVRKGQFKCKLVIVGIEIQVIGVIEILDGWTAF
jgi:hypothetical protein